MGSQNQRWIKFDEHPQPALNKPGPWQNQLAWPPLQYNNSRTTQESLKIASRLSNIISSNFIQLHQYPTYLSTELGNTQLELVSTHNIFFVTIYWDPNYSKPNFVCTWKLFIAKLVWFSERCCGAHVRVAVLWLFIDSVLICFALLCFALLCFALLCFAFISFCFFVLFCFVLVQTLYLF